MFDKNTGATFYRQKNYQGPGDYYPESKLEYNLRSEVNDKYFSVKVGALSKVDAWRHFSNTQDEQIYQVWEKSQSDISSIRGLSKFIVTPKNIPLFSVKLNNNTCDGNFYKLCIRIDGIMISKDVVSGWDYEIVGLIPEDGRLYFASIMIFNRDNIPVLQGGVYFSYNMLTKELEVTTYPDIAPKGVIFVKMGSHRFDINLEYLPNMMHRCW